MFKFFSLYDFKRVFPISLLLSLSFFGMLYFLTRPLENSGNSFYISLGIVLVLSLVALLLFTIQNRLIATEYIVSEYDEEKYSFAEIIADCQNYVVPYGVLIALYLLCYNLIIPAIGMFAGGIFQVSLFGIDFNILTLLINLVMIAWVFLGLAQIVTIDAGFFETISYTISFVFDNLLKMIFFFIIVIGLLFCFQFILVSTYTANQIYAMPIKIFAFAYLFAVCNSYTITFFAKNASLEDDEDDEYDDEYDEDEY